MNGGVNGNGQNSRYPDPYGSSAGEYGNRNSGAFPQPGQQHTTEHTAQWNQHPRDPQHMGSPQHIGSPMGQQMSPMHSPQQPQGPQTQSGLQEQQAQPRPQGQQAQRVHPGQQGQQPQGDPQFAQPKKRWSTPAVAALLLVGAIAASATTAVVIDQTGGGSVISNGATTSFDSKSNNQSQQTSAEVTPGSIEDVSQRVLPSVVSIKVQTRQGGGEGSGSIFSSDGLIVTNNHVVGAAENGGRIQVLTNDGRQLDAKIVATDPQTDIAVIKAEGANDLKPIELGDSDALNVGADVLAVGSPLGLAATVTSGIVSAKNRPVQASGEGGGEASLIDAIQTDAAINPGNSGGALVDMQGKLVGIPSVIATLGGSAGQQSGSIGLGFAIPINQAQRIVQELVDNGKAQHPIIGAKVDTSPNSESIMGAPIVDVNDGSPAEKAGLKRGDIVTKVNNRPVDSGVGLIAAIRSHNVGDTITLTAKEGEKGDERQLEMTLDAE
ncbi:Periplasmic pH-dependent serine endoprotease DegQ precursor [Corynebacterium urogenitale]|uniref:Periplasmic pH-dependent serine endoprotease DegQ n=2 Tax=Corynebacterium urogenitale TaxID=2487892 RepID=A0A5J6ZBY5_9CORY|nr:Periplasmic pH-dependent serine endoprotease DegQ precursor [Corynebacterium urogenitale]